MADSEAKKTHSFKETENICLQNNQSETNNATHETSDENSLKLSEIGEPKPLKKLKLITWNIDGLSPRDLRFRYCHIASVIEDSKYDVALLQEVVAESLRHLRETLVNYEIFDTSVSGSEYFNAILIRKGEVSLDQPRQRVLSFEKSAMGRTLQRLQVKTIGGAKLVLLNTHLESCKANSKERMNQLGLCFHLMSKEDQSDVTTIFGGDLNIRDWEMDQFDQISGSAVDLWKATGSKPDCEHTWDMKVNYNLQFPEPWKFQPQFRFDRLFLQACDPPQLRPVHFGLIGLHKVPGTRSFPSDHWGIEIHFEICDTK